MTDTPPSPDAPAGVRRRVHYACIGHPGWPDPLWVYTPERAQGWLDEHRERFPGIRVEKVTTICEQWPGGTPTVREPDVIETADATRGTQVLDTDPGTLPDCTCGDPATTTSTTTTSTTTTSTATRSASMAHVTTPATVTAGGSADRPRTFTVADRERLLAAQQETVAFEEFLLRRFQAYVRGKHASVDGQPGRRELLNTDAAEGTIERGRLRLANGWTTYRAMWAGDEQPVVLTPHTANERGPGTDGPTVSMPWSWVWGTDEREQRYATYLALREEFEGPRGLNPTDGPH